MQNDAQHADRHRLDRWLWFTRFYKTRSLAAQAIASGKARANGARVKAAHRVRIGDELSITIQFETYEIEVLQLPARRGPASEAKACYREGEASVQRRATLREQRRIAELSRPQSDMRPDKRERRQLDRLRRGQVR